MSAAHARFFLPFEPCTGQFLGACTVFWDLLSFSFMSSVPVSHPPPLTWTRRTNPRVLRSAHHTQTHQPAPKSHKQASMPTAPPHCRRHQRSISKLWSFRLFVGLALLSSSQFLVRCVFAPFCFIYRALVYALPTEGAFAYFTHAAFQCPSTISRQPITRN